MPTDLLDLLPLWRVSVDQLRAEMDADVNAGLDPADPRFTDTTPGGVYYDVTQAFALGLARVSDRAAIESVAAAIPLFAWGDYLDYHGQSVRVLRKASVEASGAALFSGTPGTLVPAGTRVSTQAPDAATNPVEFQTVESRILAASPGPTSPTATPSASGGTLPAGTRSYAVTALVGGIETVASPAVTATTTGTTSSVTLTWTAVAGATGYQIYSGLAGDERLLDAVGAVTTYVDTGAAVAGADKPPTNLISITATEVGFVGNVAANAIDLVTSGVPGVTAVTNPLPTSGGADVETDDLYRGRIMDEWAQPSGGGNIVDYRKWARGFPPVGYVTVEPLWAGPGTIRLIVTDQANNPVSSFVLLGLQTYLDPAPVQQGYGQAPIGALVTVATPALVTVNPSAAVAFEPGYSLDGTSGTTPTRDAITDAIRSYIDTLNPGDDVLLNRVEAQFFEVLGVYDVSGVLLNGSAANVPISSLQVARTGAVTLTP